MKILVVEDDKSLAEVIHKALTTQHYLVELAADGQTGLELAEAFEYDLILLDLGLPKLDGISFCQRLRKEGDRTPILLLTAQDSSTQKVAGLDAGADDYIVKPFELPELQARIRTWLRRGSATSVNLVWGGLCLNPSHCQITYDGRSLSLTAKEYALLELLLRHPHRIFSQSDLLDRLWSFDKTPSENAVRTHIKSLRQKLKQAGAAADFIETVYGLGYRLKEQPEAVARVTKQDCQNLSLPSQTSLTGVWERHKPQYRKRLIAIEEAVAAWRSGHLNEQLRQHALREAHTLAGSLGSFGLGEASRKSRESEQILQSELSPEAVKQLSALINELQQALGTGKEKPPSLPFINTEQGTGDRERELTSYSPVIPATNEPRLLIVDSDEALAQELVSTAIARAMSVEIARTFSEAREVVASRRPDLVLLETHPNSGENGFELLRELTTAQPPLPVVVLTAQKSLANRIEVARLGGQGFIQKPASPTQVMATIAQVLQPSPAAAKLLAIDDDPQILDLLRAVLQPWGFELVLLSKAQQFWEVLEETQPDLLILDVAMPEVRGIELCQVIRNDSHWQEIPVLFLSACRDRHTIQQVFAAGADDYVLKPIVEAELVARILNRLERERYRNQLAQTEATRTTNRQTAIQQLERLFSLAKRQEKPCCFVLLGLDRGDRLLKHFGQQLKQSFRNEDVIACWGEEEFILCLYDMTQSLGLKRLTEFLEFYQQNTSRSQTQVSLSAGVAEYPRDGTEVVTLYQAAGKALYQSKKAGGQIMVFEEI